MLGRRTDEAHRAATPLELLYDLTIVVAFSISGSQAAHALAAGHVASAIVAFLFSVFAIVWAWINFTWFASAFDNDDWVMRLATLVQMVGVIVLSLGLANLYHGFETWHLHNEVMVAGYVVMRASMVFLWLRAARHNPDQAPQLRLFAIFIAIAQCGWILTAGSTLPWPALLPILVVLYAVEMGGVVFAERRSGGTPWHPEHVAERYSLLVIISLGEIILGTTIAVEALIDRTDWSVDAALIAAAGISLAFGMWWTYFAMPFAEVLQKRPERGFGFGYGHLPLYGAIAAVGTGLHVAAYYIEGESTLSEPAVMLSMALPVTAFILIFFAIARWMLPGRDRFHGVLIAASLTVIVAAVVLAWTSVPLGVSLTMLMLAPWITVLGYELRGHRHVDEVLAHL